MARWFYSGKVTTPVNIPGRGPSIIQPRMTFDAPESAVAHLLRLRLVKRVDTPPAQEEAKPVIVAAPIAQKPEPPLAATIPPPPRPVVEKPSRVSDEPDVGLSSSVDPVPAGDSEPEPSESQDQDASPRRRRRSRFSEPTG